MLQDADVPCGSCNLCCRGKHLVVLLPEFGDDPRLYKVQVGKQPDRRRPPPLALAFQANGDCAHLIDGKCEVYDRRPTLCRAYDCREDYLKTPRAERRRREKAGTASAEVYRRGAELLEQL